MFLDFSPRVMGIWNLSPDSFSSDCEKGLAVTREHAQKLVAQGADVVDIGAESTRPGAVSISSEEEIARLEEPLMWARAHLAVPLSLDSYHVETVEWALEKNLIDIVNDVGESTQVSEAREGRLYRAVARHHAAIILMAWGNPKEALPSYEVCIREIQQQLERRYRLAREVGVHPKSIAVDPGIGFGKGFDNDLKLIHNAPRDLAFLSSPVVIAHSRKRCLGYATGLPKSELDDPTAIACAIALKSGAAILRVHRPDLACMARSLVFPKNFLSRREDVPRL